jgi:hypothetical protein
MADRPIIFSAPMILALLERRKTMTRRVLRAPRWSTGVLDFELGDDGVYAIARETGCLAKVEPPYAIGDRLWVREAHYMTDDGDTQFAVFAADRQAAEEHLKAIAELPASFPESVRREHLKLRPSIHMPRWASRLTLIVESVKIERLQDISEADALAEGVEFETADPPFYYVPGLHPHSITAVGIEERCARPHAVGSYAKLWSHIHRAGEWERNPYVAAITFRTICANIDTLDAASATPRQEAAHV